MADGGSGTGLRGRLVAMLFAFGALPLAAVVVAGYAVSRNIITDQAERALREMTAQQALHLATELDRERLLLRSIAGQLPEDVELGRTPATVLERLLVQGLPEGGVFDGLRIVTGDTVLASVALRNTAPHWPPNIPAAAWSRRRVVVHREASQAVAYLVAVPAMAPPGEAWLEGHVRAADFPAIFGLPEHLMGGVELAVLDGGREVVTIGHEHAREGLREAFARRPADSVTVTRITLNGETALATAAVVEGSDWVVAAALPTEVALAPLFRLRDATLAGVVVLVALIVATGVLASGSVTRPLRELAAAARRFGTAGAYEPVRASGGGEVADLVEAFDRMAEDLKRSRVEIDQLHQSEMERAQQLATVGELASGVAHEIRNPLTGVHGAIDLALRRPLDEASARPLLEEAQRQLTRIENTTTQLLRYARPPELRQILVDANELAERAVRVVEPQGERSGIGFILEPSDGALRVLADPELIVQVLVNLLLNAVDVTPRGGTVRVWIAHHAPDAWIAVRDTGPGIAHDERERIFRPFFTTKGQGTGLGLSISRQIVMRHQGSLRVEDTPGGGATFLVALPVATGGVE